MRLFVALNLPAVERERLHEAVRPLRDGGLPFRWVGPAQLHVTLKFLGEVAEGRREEVAHVVEESARAVRPFEVALGGVGAFPSLRRPRVVWLGVEPSPELRALQDELETRFERLGFEREARAFHPHVTLGRAGDARGRGGRRADHGARPSAGHALESLADSVRYRATVRVETLDLMQSRLRPSGAEYEVLHAARLGAVGGSGSG